MISDYYFTKYVKERVSAENQYTQAMENYEMIPVITSMQATMSYPPINSSTELTRTEQYFLKGLIDSISNEKMKPEDYFTFQADDENYKAGYKKGLEIQK